MSKTTVSAPVRRNPAPAPAAQPPRSKRSWSWLGSLRLAVPLMVLICAVLAWGTMYETRYGTAAVGRFVYRAWWFQAVLALLGVSMAAAAADRWPWRRQQWPFLLAHFGIILMLIGGIMSSRAGIDGQLVIPEGGSENRLLLMSNVLAIEDPGQPGHEAVLPTNFETTAWNHAPAYHATAVVNGRSVQVSVDTYYPDAAMEERYTDDGAEPATAVRVALGEEGEERVVWLGAGDGGRAALRSADTHLFLMDSGDAPVVGPLLEGLGARAGSGGVLTVSLEDLGVSRELPVPERLPARVALDGTPYAVVFREVFTDLVIGEQGVTNRSAEPRNPAVAFTLVGPEGEEPMLAFALFPDFSAIHGREPLINAHVHYRHHGGPALPPDALAVIAHPAGDLTCLMTGSAGEWHLAPCQPGVAYRHPWLQERFVIDARYARARRTTEVVNRSREVKQPMLRVVLQEGDARAETWAAMGEPAAVSLSGRPLTVTYRPDQQALPLTVKLLDFRKIDYPGTGMPAGFESDVQLTDAPRGVILMRTIKMNEPLRYGGYSFFQSGYHAGPPETTVLSVRRDPGTPLVYLGFLLITVGMGWMFWFRTPRPRRAA